MSDNDLIRRGDAREILEDEGFLERSLERLAALPAVTVGVRPLEFVYGVAESIVGNYLIDSGWKDKVGGERWWAWAGPISGESDPFYAWQHGTRADDEKAAKAAAQADYEARLLAALDLTPAPDAPAEIDLRAVEMERIEEAASQSPWVPAEYSMSEVVSDCCAFLREPRQPAPDAAAIREAALREARQRVNDLVAERQAYLHGARNDFNRGAVGALQEACSAILALIPTKGGDGRRVYMGQIMAECDCPREAECQAAGRCIAEGRR